MTEPDDVPETDAVIPRAAFTRRPEHYLLAALAYFVIALATKTLLTWTMALLYFVLVLDVAPRVVSRIRAALVSRGGETGR